MGNCICKVILSEPELELAGPQKNEQGVNMYCRLTRQDFKIRLLVIPIYCAHVACGRVYKVSFGIRHRLPEGPPLASKPRNPNTAASKRRFGSHSSIPKLGFELPSLLAHCYIPNIPSQPFLHLERQDPSQRGAPSPGSSGLPMSSANQCGGPER